MRTFVNSLVALFAKNGRRALALFALTVGCQSNPTAELVHELNPDRRYEDATLAVLPLVTSGLPTERGQYYADRITDEIVRSGRYRVLERSLVDRVLAEQRFQNSGLADAEQAVRIGRLLSAKLVITGIVYGRPDGADLFIRLIEVESGVILKSAHRQVFEERETAESRPASDNVKKPVVVEMQPEEEALGEILDLAAVPSVGNIVVIGRMRNTGSVTIGTPSLRVGLYDAAGEEIDTVQCFPGVDLPAKTVLPFQCASLNTQVRFASLKLLHFKPQVARSDLYVFDLSVIKPNLRYDGFSYHLTGTIHHTGKVAVKYPRVVATFFDEKGAFVGSAHGFGDDKELQPGQQTRFQTSLWALGGRRPVRYEMLVVGLKN